MDTQCMVCKYASKIVKESLEATSRSMIYINNSGKEIHLCRDHSRQLFLEGQRRFIKNNLRVLRGASLTMQTDSWFFNYMSKLELD